MNPRDIFCLVVLYLVFVLKVGKLMMKNRAPFQINGLLVAYNTFKVISSGALAVKIFAYVLEKGLFPQECVHDNYTMYRIASMQWQYLVTKALDMMDTVFFVLRKKDRQISFLHVYHHGLMVVGTWMCLKYDPSDHWGFTAFANCIVHSVMYVYYGIAAMGPEYAKFLWWKKYLTIMQVTQFSLITLHIVAQAYSSHCPINPITYWAGIGNMFLFTWLFIDFYMKRYNTKSAVEKQKIGFACTEQHVE